MDVKRVLGEEVQPFRGRKPPWFKVPPPGGPKYRELTDMIKSEGLHTVCQEAACPNVGECWERGTATFMILGDTCTRRCGFCNVKTGKPTWNDPLEPARVARSVAKMGLRHAVITSVDRDDLPDYGASAFVGVIRSIRMQAPECKVEVLTPDFRGEEMPLAKVITERPDVFNHNVEVVPRLYPVARRGSRWERSLRVLRNAKEMGGDEVVTKSGLMVGLGETHEEMVEAFGALREHGVQVLTVGQYLRPTERHLPVVRFWHPDEFKALEDAAYALGLRPHRRRPARALELPRRPARAAVPARDRSAGRRRLVRTAITFVALAFTTILGFLTLFVIFETGLDVLSAISLIVVAVFFFGIFGAFEPEVLMPYHVFQGGRRRRRRRWPAVLAVLLLVGAGVAAGLTLAPRGGDDEVAKPPAPPVERSLAADGPAPLAAPGRRRLRSPCGSTTRTTRCGSASTPAARRAPVRPGQRAGPVAARARRSVLPIASLTKMMTALVVVDGGRAGRECGSPARRCATAARASACSARKAGSASTRCCTGCCCRRATTPRSRSRRARAAAACGASCG